jgi:hypothetical protein
MYKGRLVLPRQSYKDWLRLTTLYFDAIAILSDHVSSLSSPTDVNRDIDVDIKILVPSLPDQKMLPWKELVRHELYFPKLPDEPASEQTSSEDIITFLESDFDTVTGRITDWHNERAEGIKGKKGKGKVGKRESVGIDEVVRSLRKFVDQQVASEVINLDGTIDSVIDEVNCMNDCLSPGWCEYFTITILEQLRALKGRVTSLQTLQCRLTLSREILEMVVSLRDHSESSLFQQLKEDTPLSRGDNFLGTGHCEALISLSGLSGSHTLGASNEIKVSLIFMPFSNVCLILQYRNLDQL